MRQIAGGYATPQDGDRTWILSFGVDLGPCGLMDNIGLHSVLAVEMVYHQNSGDPGDQLHFFLVEMVACSELGVKSGKGFYTYPAPAYRQPGFLEGVDDD